MPRQNYCNVQEEALAEHIEVVCARRTGSTPACPLIFSCDTKITDDHFLATTYHDMKSKPASWAPPIAAPPKSILYLLYS